MTSPNVGTTHPEAGAAFDELVERFHLDNPTFRISDDVIRRYHLATTTRGFVILCGPSGTGKTWLAQAYANVIGARQKLVAVDPSWSSNEDLLGYLSPLDGFYHHTPFSEFVADSAREWNASNQAGRVAREFHVILDEMNLARVEHYFSRFLSAMEVRTREGIARLDLAPGHTVELTPNLKFSGTVNIDETTHGFADKVYDRAQILELPLPRDMVAAHMADYPWKAARRRGEPLDHVLLAGPPGLGKTSLAYIVAAELGVPMVQTAGPALERKADVAAFLTALEPGSVFFIDEIHRLGRAVEETLYPAMEDGRLPVVLGQGAGARTVTLPLPPFTLIGATTRSGLLTTPLRDRFGVCHRLEHYSAAHLAQIISRSAGILEVEVEADGARAIAERSRGTPRVANRLLKRVRDFAQVKGEGVITSAIAASALEMLEVDGIGLDRSDRRLLQTIAEKFGGGPVGLSTLAVAIGEEEDTIEDVLEPYLLQEGLVKRTPRGRVLTPRAYEHLGLPLPEGAASLF